MKPPMILRPPKMRYTARSQNPALNPSLASSPKCTGLQLKCTGIPKEPVFFTHNRALQEGNSGAADGFYHIVPRGEHPGITASGKTVVQVIDQEAVDKIMAAFRAVRAKPNFSGLLLDWEHFSYQDDKKSEAAGWILDVVERPDGIYARIDWTPAGEKDVTSRAYRFLSPTLDIETIEGNRVRPIAITDAGLTNVPMFKTLKTLNRAGAVLPAEKQHGEKEMEKIKALLLRLLGLPDDASEADIDAAAEKALSVAEQETLREENEALLTQNRDLCKALADHDLREYEAVIADPEAIREGLTHNREATLKILRGLRKESPRLPIHNRTTASRPATSPIAGSKATATLAQKQRAAVEEYRTKNRCTFRQAWDAVRTAQPELFPAPDDGSDNAQT